MDGWMKSGYGLSAAEVSDSDDVDESKDNKGDDKEGNGRNVFVCLFHHLPTPAHPEPYQ